MKHLFIGIDGTWRAAFYDRFLSNVYRLNMSLSSRDTENNPQIFIYGAGIGTGSLVGKVMGGAFGEGLDEVILGSYINLVSNYEPGDKIYLFGFSRGAVAARALSDLITISGLVRSEFSSVIEDAWRYFVGDPKRDYAAIRGDVTHDNVHIEFLGLWDTVAGFNPYRTSAASLFNRLRLRDLNVARCVKHAVHIVAIDETRRRFRPMLWSKCSHAEQLAEQIWLPGVHTDVGGGYENSFLSTISLITMIDKLRQYATSISIEHRYIERTLFPIIETEPIVVHDERANHVGATSPRELQGKRHHGQSVHPITDMIRNQTITFKNAKIPYLPSFRADEPSTPADFEPGSFYSSRVWEILKQRSDLMEKLPQVA